MSDNRPFRGRTSQVQRAQILKIFQLQLVILISVTCLLFFLAGKVAAYSGLLGGLIYLLPGFYQARQALKPIDSASLRQVLQDMYKSEIWKMVLMAVMFGAVFAAVRPLEPFSLFSVFVLLQLIAWLAPLFARKRQAR